MSRAPPPTNPLAAAAAILSLASTAYGLYSATSTLRTPPATPSHADSLYERDNLSRLQGIERIEIFLQPFIATFAALQVSPESFLSQSVMGEVRVQHRLAPSSSSLSEKHDPSICTPTNPPPMTMAHFLSRCLALVEHAEQLRKHVGTANQDPSVQGRDLAISSAFEEGFEVLNVYREVSDVLRAVGSESELLNLRNGLNLVDTSMQAELERMYEPVQVGEKKYQLRLTAEPLLLQSVGETGVFGGRKPSKFSIAPMGSSDVTFSFELDGCDVKYGAHVWLKYIPDYSHGPYKVMHWDERFREREACNRSICFKDRIILKDVHSNKLLSRKKTGNSFKVGLGVGDNYIWVIARSM